MRLSHVLAPRSERQLGLSKHIQAPADTNYTTIIQSHTWYSMSPLGQLPTFVQCILPSLYHKPVHQSFLVSFSSSSQVLERKQPLRQIEKREFSVDTTEFLGFVISPGSLRMDEANKRLAGSMESQDSLPNAKLLSRSHA
jgi:hypothetical protein